MKRREDKVQLPGLTAAMPIRTESLDVRGNVFESWTEFDSETKVQSSYRRVPYATNLEVSHTRFGQTIEIVSLSGVTNTPGYDALGRVVSSTDGRGNATTFLYNAQGQRVCAIDAATNATWYAFDEYGRLASVTNALGEATVYEYNLQGRKTYEGGGTYPVRFTYDDEGRMTSMTTYRDESGPGDTTAWTYDPATGLLVQKLYEDGKGPSYTYTPDGKLATRTWARGVTTTYAYDGWGSLTNIVHSDGTPSVSMTYDVMGRQIQTSDAAGVTTFAYDSFSSLTNETVSGQYDKSLERHVDSYGRNVGYSVDGQRKQSLVNDTATGRIVGMDGFAWEYLSGTDLKSRLVYPNGTVAEWEYEPQRDLLTLVSNDVFSAYAYENDEAGRRTAKNTERYDYNNRGELIAATNTAPVANYAYSFDDIGNRIVANELGTNFAYTANALNQYTNIVSTVAFIPEFDDDGNQTQVKTSTGIWNVMYNAENRPVVWSNDTAVVTMDFDRMGRRVWYASVSGGETNVFSKFVYNGYLCVQKLDGTTGNIEQEYVWDPTETVATRPLKWTLPGLGRTFLYFHDGNKNVADAIDASDGSLAAHYDYAPFGAVTSATGPLAAVNPYRFSSEWHDDELGCVYYNYRHYNPLDGRWMNRDPIEEFGGSTLEFSRGLDFLLGHLVSTDISEDIRGENNYAIALNSPVDRFDYLGLLAVKDCCGDVEYDSKTSCCIDPSTGQTESRNARMKTGIRRCCFYSASGGNTFLRVLQLPDHCWVEYPGGARGFYPSDMGGLKDEVSYPTYPNKNTPGTRKCNEVESSSCSFDTSKAAECLKTRSNILPYFCGVNDCRDWSRRAFNDCKSAGRRDLP